MSFLNSLKSFFTLKTSDQLRDEAFDKKQEKVNNQDWMIRRHDLDYVYNSLGTIYNVQNSCITKCKDIIVNLLGDKYAGLLNPPIIQQCMVDMNIGERKGAIHLQWATGNFQDEMTVLSVGFSIAGYRLTCASKCISPTGVIRGSFVSEWLPDIVSLPGWFEDVLELLKNTHHEHITEPNMFADLHIENVVGKTLIENNNKLDIVRGIRDIITYLLHDEYQDLAYHPIISKNLASNDDYVISMGLQWKLKNDTVRLDVARYLTRDDQYTIEFTIGEGGNKVTQRFNHLDEEQAKQLALPLWFLVALQKIKNNANERSDT